MLRKIVGHFPLRLREFGQIYDRGYNHTRYNICTYPPFLSILQTATPAVVTLPTETADKIGGAAPGPSYITNISSPMRSTNAASPSIKRR